MIGNNKALSTPVITEKLQALSGIQRGGRLAMLLLPLVLILAPGAAPAQNECGVQVGTTPVECDQASYGSGVTYDALGDLFIDFINTPTTTVGGNGVTLTGDGAESITFDSQSTNTELQSNGTTGALLGVTTVNGDIDIDTEEMDADASAAGVTHAIYAESTGSGNIDINTTGIVDANSGSNPATSIGIEAITNSGDITLTTMGTVNGNQYSIRADSGGAMEVNLVSGFVNSGAHLTAVDEITVNNSTSLGGVLTGVGDTLVLNNSGNLNGVLDFSELTGGYIFNNQEGGAWNINQDRSLVAGVLNNAGTINFSGNGGQVVSSPGTAYTGMGTGLLEMDVFLDGTSQTSCSAITVADCLDLSGGMTAGQTGIRVEIGFVEELGTPLENASSATNAGIVLVDVSGGTSQSGHFVLDPGSDNYVEDSLYGSVLDLGGLLSYTLLYDPTTQQHLLANVPKSEGVQYAAYIQEAVSVWHTTTDAVVGRRIDLQDDTPGGGWVQALSTRTERDSAPTFTSHGNTFTYDQSYTLDTHGLIGGFDALYADNYVLGFHGGIVSSRMEFDDSATKYEADTAVAGIYGGWWNERGLSLDGAVNANFQKLEHDVPDQFEQTDTNIQSLGARLEAAWRLPVLGERLYVQPLVTAAYMRADIDNLPLKDNELDFEGAESSRVALGGRLGGEISLTGERFSHIGYWLTVRAWEEYAEDGEVRFATSDGGYLAIEDDISESFEEVGLGVSLTSPDENLEVFLSGNVRSGDHTDGNNVTIGARMRW